MRSAVDIIFNAHLSRQPEERRIHLLKYLPHAEQERLKHLPSFTNAVSPAAFSNDALLERVHWSWLLPTLKSSSKQEQSLFLAALDPSAAEPLAAHIPCKASREELSSIGRTYLRQVLLDSLIGAHDRLVPMDYLPPSPMNRLLNLSKRQIIGLIDLLSIYDLAIEVRQIVETKILKKLYSFLTDAERKLLKQIAARPEPFTPPKIGLERWNGEEDSLRHSLHKRGLSRLGLALSGQDPALIWYICHQLDIGRGNALFKQCIKEEGAGSPEIALRQVDELLGHESL